MSVVSQATPYADEVEEVEEGSEDELPEGEVTRRVAFSIASLTIRCQVADVDVAAGSIVTVHSDKEAVAEGDDWHLARGVGVVGQFARKATALGSTQCAAVCSEFFGRSAGGRAFLDRLRSDLGLEVRVLRAEDEDALGPCDQLLLSTAMYE